MVSIMTRLKFCLLIILVFILPVAACTKNEQYAGIYTSQRGNETESMAITIELKENGNGIFRANEEESSFAWEIRNHKILIHTKSGGIITGEINNQSMVIKLPGNKFRTLQKIS
jgi:hypothetical protein